MKNREEFQVNQSQELSLQMKKKGQFQYRYAYARSAESQLENEIGQDYLIYRCSEDQFVFAVCDGVGLSFHGDVAAAFLGEKLCEWLEKQANQDGWNELELQSALSAFLSDLIPEATNEVENIRLDSSIGGFHKEVLEEKRTRGSEATFVCGRIDFLNVQQSQPKILLAWQGDSKVKLWRGNQERSQLLKAPFLTNQRWSTKRGPVGGEPHVFTMDALEKNRIDRLTVYTDGLSELDHFTYPIKNEELKNIIQQANSKAESDDLTFLEIGWNNESVLEEQSHSLKLLFQRKLTREDDTV